MVLVERKNKIRFLIRSTDKNKYGNKISGLRTKGYNVVPINPKES